MTLPCSQVFKVEHSVPYLLITSVAQVRKDLFLPVTKFTHGRRNSSTLSPIKTYKLSPNCITIIDILINI